MKIKEMNKIINDKNSQDLNCNFKITGKGTSKFDLVLKQLEQIESRLDKVDEFIAEQRQFNKLIMSRLDNLVSKNNLKE